ncbi:MAG: hypothetical protein H7Z18_08035 [Methylophilaceae bacterium]|nr:hypothetical protein [Methylophilaceae bacterium]
MKQVYPLQLQKKTQISMQPYLHSSLKNKGLSSRKTQSGIIMFITLISLVVMLLSSIALVRSTDTSMLIAGHLSFRRDITNQAERAIPAIRVIFQGTGALSTVNSRNSDQISANYYATIQSSNAFGIPNALINTGSATYNTNVISDATSGVTVRYLIDRMCLPTTANAPASAANCGLTLSVTDNSTSGPDAVTAKGPDIPIYRISVRATGPRNTETYMQSTFTVN